MFNASCREILVKFTLIYDGILPPGDSQRAKYAGKIRNVLHGQLKDLWDNHVLMRQLVHEARIYEKMQTEYGLSSLPAPLSDYTDVPPPLRDGQIDLTAPIEMTGVGNFLPIVRRSLHLACGLEITFLRHEEPYRLFEQSGDLDNRLKCFFDALSMPADISQATAGEDPCADPLCCLLENDRWISDFSLRAGRLLGKTEKHKHDVRIQADVTVKVLRVFEGNLGLVGG
jgi:hypothetical protein